MAARIFPLEEIRHEVPKVRFSLMRGGIVYRLERRLGLINDLSLGVGRRVLAFWGVTWLPIALLELLRMAGARTTHVPHLLIISGLGVNVRFLISGAILILAEPLVEAWVSVVISQLVSRRVVENPKELDAVLAVSRRQIEGTPGIASDLFFLVLVFVGAAFGIGSVHFGPYQDWRSLAPMDEFSPGVAWYFWIAIPLLYYLLLRWVWRFAAWVRALWGISKLTLRLNSSHPDLAGGLGFLTFAQEAFAPIWLAVSASAAASVALRVRMLGVPLQKFYAPIASLVAAETFLLLLPLTFFVPRMILAKREGIVLYGALANDYVKSFHRKWVNGERDSEEQLLGSSDIEQWANVGIGLERSRKMIAFPAPPMAILGMVLAGLLPFLPLVLLQVPAEQILRAALKLLV